MTIKIFNMVIINFSRIFLLLICCFMTEVQATSYDPELKQLSIQILAFPHEYYDDFIVRLDDFSIVPPMPIPDPKVAYEAANASSFDARTNELLLPVVSVGDVYYRNVRLKINRATLISFRKVTKITNIINNFNCPKEFNAALFRSVKRGMTFAQVKGVMGCAPAFSTGSPPQVIHHWESFIKGYKYFYFSFDRFGEDGIMLY